MFSTAFEWDLKLFNILEVVFKHNAYSTVFYFCFLRRETFYTAGVSSDPFGLQVTKKEVKLGANAMERVAVGAHVQSPRIFGPAERQHDRDHYCLC